MDFIVLIAVWWAEVRMASLDALCQLAKEFPQFSVLSLDFLVDMFNDEIDIVRWDAFVVVQSMV